MIHARQLTKRYALGDREQLALAGVSFDVLPGQIFGLLGPNGAGKTTVLRILATLLQPTTGRAVVAGHDVTTDAAEVRRKIGFVSTNTAIYDRMTGWETVAYFGRLHEIPEEPLGERMERLFRRLQLDSFRDVLGSHLSTGMAQRISIARALIHDPPVLILDEASAGLDVVAARGILEVVESLRADGKCIVFSSHVMSEVRRLCDRIAVMSAGRIVAEGSVPELIDRYGEPDLEELFYRLIADARCGDEVASDGIAEAPR